LFKKFPGGAGCNTAGVMVMDKAVSVSRVLMVRLFLFENEDDLEFNCKVIKGDG
jgi:hypothetical protein